MRKNTKDSSIKMHAKKSALVKIDKESEGYKKQANKCKVIRECALKQYKSVLSFGNAKLIQTGLNLDSLVIGFDLPAGLTCPFAKDCKSHVELIDGKRVRIDSGEFVCYAAKLECTYPDSFKLRRSNWKFTKQINFVKIMIKLLNAIHAKNNFKPFYLRIHSSGDFYTREYWLKWIEIIKACPFVTFYGYSKNPVFVKLTNQMNLQNFKLVYSIGGVKDNLALDWNLPACYVVKDYKQAESMGLDVICDTAESESDDIKYILAEKSFALLLH